MRLRLVIAILAAIGGPPCVPGLTASDAARRGAGPTEVRTDSDQVDFSAPPAAGLEFKVEERGEFNLEGTVAVEGQAVKEIKQRTRARLVLTQKIDAVEGRRVVGLERNYGEYRLHIKQVTKSEDDQDTQEWDQTHPLHRKRLRARWKGDDLALEVQDHGDWKAADASLANRLSTRKLLHPVLPVPGSVKRVGDRWQLSREALADYFCDAFDCPPDKVELEGQGQVRFTGFARHATGRCAVLEARFDVKVGKREHPKSHFRLTAVCHYNLRRRIVVALDAKGTVETEGRMKNNDRTYDIRVRGTVKTRSEVEIKTEERACGSGSPLRK
jgi:hypothetical protein